MKVGDYIRQKRGLIYKIQNKEELESQENITNLNDECYYIKSSSNIIDLIQVGDYVNGYYVDEITDIDTGLPVLCNFDLNTMRWTPLEEIDIWYSIVTKEQFESMKYEVK